MAEPFTITREQATELAAQINASITHPEMSNAQLWIYVFALMTLLAMIDPVANFLTGKTTHIKPVILALTIGVTLIASSLYAAARL